MTDHTTDDRTEALDGHLQRLSSLATNRRRFLLGAGGVAALGVLAACGSDDEASTATTDGGSDTSSTTSESESESAEDSTTSTTAADGAADLKIGAFAASLEVLAVNTYGAALDAATAGKLGEVPPAVAEFVTTAKDHHQAALDAWNKVLEDAGEEAVDKPPADLEKTVNAAFGEVTDVGGAAKLALMLEQTAAATYQAVLPSLTVDGAKKLAASIQPIDMQHAAVLMFVLGEYPVPETFSSTEMAATPA